MALVVSDRPKAGCLDYARQAGIPVWSEKPAEFPDKAVYEAILIEELGRREIDGIVLAGYMRLCGTGLLRRYGGKIVNLHPSLLPAFAGLRAIEQAVESGAQFTGVTVHFVDEGMDTGPIIAQQVVPIGASESVESLTARIREVEHQLLPVIVAHWAQGDIRIEGRKVLAKSEVPRHGIGVVATMNGSKGEED